MFPTSNDNGLLIHHWDTDGICSAAMIFEYLDKEIDYRTPLIGNYYLTEKEIEEISSHGYDFIIIADMAIPRENILKIKKRSGAETFIFDHHLQPLIEGVDHHNPVSMGKPAEEYPSNTWVLTKYLGRDIDLLSVLGAVGDNEKKIKNNIVIFPKIEEFLKKTGLVFDDLLRIVELIDSNYKVGERDKVLDAVHFIRTNKSSPQAILENSEWKENLQDLEAEVEEQGNMPVTFEGDIAIQEINTKCNIISSLTRKLAWNNDSRVAIVVNRGYFENDDQMYIRAGQPDVILQPIIDSAKDRGYSAGGKREVAGIVLPKEDTDDFMNEVKKLLLV